jgi:heme oxygenase-like protein
MDTPSERLSAKLHLAYPALSAHAEQIWSSPFIRELYPAYLGTMHMIVRSAVPLMEDALEQARARGSADNIAAGLVCYLARHIEEESGHDTWLLEDLEATGANPEELLRRIPSPQVATFVGAQYYWLRHHHPVSLLGHLAAIESYHPPAGFANRLRNLTGYPGAAFRAIARHETLDIHHKRELYEVIDSLPLERKHEKMLGISALHTIHAEIDVLADIYAGIIRDKPA